MGPRTVCILLIAAGLLTAWYALFEREPLGQKTGPVFPQIAFADVEEMELIPGASSQSIMASAPPVLLRKDPSGQWRIVRPDVAAHIPRVESILWGIVDLQKIAALASSEGSSAFDPAGPEATVRLKTRSGEEHRVAVGRDHPNTAFDLCYARLDDKDLFLTRKAFKKNLHSRLDDLRSRALFPVPRESAVRIEVLGEPLARKSVRREEGGDGWRFDEPEPAQAGRDEIARVLDDLNAWQVDSFVRDEDGDLKPYGLDPPRTVIALTDRQGRRTAVEIGGAAHEKGRIHVRWSGKPFVMTAVEAPVLELERPAENLYSKYVIQLGAAEIVAVVVSPGGSGSPGGFTLRRAGSKPEAQGAKKTPRPEKKRPESLDGPPAWEIVEPGKEPFAGDADRLRGILETLQLLLVKRYIPQPKGDLPPETGLGSPLLRLEVSTDAGARHILTIGRPAQGSDEATQGILYIAVEGEPFYYQVKRTATIPEDLLKGPVWFKNTRISKLDPENLREFEITLRTEAGERTWTLGRPDDAWTFWADGDFIPVEGKSLNQKLVKNVVALLGKEAFRVDSWRSGEMDFAARKIAGDRFQIRISLMEVTGAPSGFQRLFIGQEEAVEGIAIGNWARVNAPGLADLPFILECQAVRVFQDLADHLQEITVPAKR